MAIQKIQPKTLHQEVAGQIREMIRTGTLSKGEKIDEKHLCESMGVSRTPVRESLRLLASEGLIDLIPHKGAYVSEPCMEEIRDMFEVMSVLEGTCARLAINKMTKRDLKRIESLHKDLERHYANQNHEAYLQANQILHVFIQDLCGNKVLNDVINGLRQKVLLYRHKQLYQPDRFKESIQEHRQVMDAFRKRDADLAEVSMKQHLIKQCEALVGVYASKEDERVKRAAA